ncbi:hypothetical protein JW868_03445 [Candidatus Woesearchaeota archaeon]|nr:hypothetical protein [Candidatus Woesearchaeota archaeon]
MFDKKLKIVITQPSVLLNDQIKRLKSLGDLYIHDTLPTSAEEWATICQGADVVCSGLAGLKDGGIYLLENVFVSLPFVGVGFLDTQKLKERKIIVSNSPGCNKDAVSEWIMNMMLNLFRKFNVFLNAKNLPEGELPDFTLGLAGKNVTVLGRGNIGSTVKKYARLSA